MLPGSAISSQASGLDFWQTLMSLHGATLPGTSTLWRCDVLCLTLVTSQQHLLIQPNSDWLASNV